MKKTLSVLLALLMIISISARISADEPSSWAQEEVEAAIGEGLVPANLQANYTSSVTRGAVAQIFVNLLEKAAGKCIDDIMAEKGVAINEGAFTDTNDKAVLAANALGIINGTGSGKFSPDGTLKRAQIAAIINRVARVMGIETEGYTHEFKDITDNYSWADSELGWPVHAGVINGVGQGRFNPGGDLTTEQAILITYRALGSLKIQEEQAEIVTEGMLSALATAAINLRTSAYSYEGLVEELESQGFSHEEAVYASDNCGADWEREAKRAAVNYIEVSPFSYQGMIDKLENDDKFTHDEAEYAARSCELDSTYQVVKYAEWYLKSDWASRDKLINVLEEAKFSQDQAVYAAENCGADWNEQAKKLAEEYGTAKSISAEMLISRLENEGFTHEQAVFGVDNCGIDWNEQASKAAELLNETGHFSKEALVGMLERIGFTHTQAVYGADHCEGK